MARKPKTTGAEYERRRAAYLKGINTYLTRVRARGMDTFNPRYYKGITTFYNRQVEKGLPLPPALKEYERFETYRKEVYLPKLQEDWEKEKKARGLWLRNAPITKLKFNSIPEAVETLIKGEASLDIVSGADDKTKNAIFQELNKQIVKAKQRAYYDRRKTEQGIDLGEVYKARAEEYEKKLNYYTKVQEVGYDKISVKALFGKKYEKYYPEYSTDKGEYSYDLQDLFEIAYGGKLKPEKISAYSTAIEEGAISLTFINDVISRVQSKLNLALTKAEKGGKYSQLSKYLYNYKKQLNEEAEETFSKKFKAPEEIRGINWAEERKRVEDILTKNVFAKTYPLFADTTIDVFMEEIDRLGTQQAKILKEFLQSKINETNKYDIAEKIKSAEYNDDIFTILYDSDSADVEASWSRLANAITGNKITAEEMRELQERAVDAMEKEYYIGEYYSERKQRNAT